MGGGLLQLVAQGAQDAYLSGNPQITFWTGLFKRHTNFAMESFRINFTGQPSWGTKQSATLNRNADLLYSTYLEVHLPSYNASDPIRKNAVYNNDQFRLGYNLIKYAELEIGGQLIDRQYGEWLFLWDTLTSTTNKAVMSHQLVGGAGRSTVAGLGGNASTGQCVGFAPAAGCSGSPASNQPGHPTILYVPLSFFYTRNPGTALPLIALQYHEVKINILWNDNEVISGDYSTVKVPSQPTQAAIYVDYIYLDVEERRRMATEAHEYLIEQVQYNEDKGLSAYSNRIDLTFNHPVKELVWVVQPTCYRSCKVPIPTTGGARNNTTNSTRLTPFTYDQNAVFKQHLQLNGQDRLDARYGDYFNKVQPYQHHTGSTGTTYLVTDLTSITPTVVSNVVTSATGSTGPTGVSGLTNVSTTGAVGSITQATSTVVARTTQQGIYCYSFALKPEEHQPSGTCNFSRIDTATLVLQMSGDVTVNQSTDQTWDVRVYAINYNIVRIMSGMAGVSYSN